MLLGRLVDVSAQVAATTKRTEKIELLAGVLLEVEEPEVEAAVGILSNSPLQGRVGVGWATASFEGEATEYSLTVGDLDDLFQDLAAMSGEGVQQNRRNRLAAFGALATPQEARFVVALLTGELRQGALSGVIEQAVAKAFGVHASLLRRAAMLSGDLPGAAVMAKTKSRSGLESVGLTVGIPIEPMLASKADTAAEAVEQFDDARVEWKLDGIRIQAHKSPSGIRLFTRNLNDITGRLPAVVQEVANLDAGSLVLDGEAMGFHQDGSPAAFQDSLAATDVRAGWFDVLHSDGTDWIDAPLAERSGVLDALVGERRIRGEDATTGEEAERVYLEAVEAGHEGVVVKDLGSKYAAGRRGKAWRKVKPVHTLDLVVIGVEWGSGRRKGTLSNLHLGALDSTGAPVMVGKTFKGLTDKLLAWQTKEFLSRQTGAEGHIVWVRPDLVVEIALDGAQRSTRYPGGVALRFARVRRYREDRAAESADTLDAVRALLH